MKKGRSEYLKKMIDGLMTDGNCCSDSPKRQENKAL